MENQASQPAAPTAPVPPPAAQPAVTPPPASAPATPNAPQNGKSSKMGLIIVIVITLLLAVAGWLIYANYMNKPEPVVEEKVVASPTPTVTPEPTQGPVKSGDSELDSQSDAIDQTMDKVDADVKDVDSSLNDQADSLN